MRNANERQILSILENRSGVSANLINRRTRLVEDLRIDGDDAIETIKEVCDAASIDTSNFKSGEYFRSEPSIFSIFRRSPQRKTFTVGQLLDALAKGKL